MPAHVADNRGSVKVQKRYTKRTKETDCLTCPASLTEKDRAAGCRRCRKCRTKTPGRPVMRRYADREPNTQTVVTKPRREAPRESWWMDKTREQLNAEAAQRFDVPPRGLVLNHGIAFDAD